MVATRHFRGHVAVLGWPRCGVAGAHTAYLAAHVPTSPPQVWFGVEICADWCIRSYSKLTGAGEPAGKAKGSR